jgi:hypothetical protein
VTDETPIPIDLPIEARIQAAVALSTEAAVVSRAISLIAGNNEGEDFLLLVGGEHARGILGGAPPLYWPELWGTRALLYVWDDTARPAVEAALRNRAWRVREMACRVSAVRALQVSATLKELLADEVPRVRAASARALGDVGDAGDEEAVRLLLRDPELEVRRAAGQALAKLSERHAR